MRLCGAVPVLDFLSSLTLGVAVALLDLSFELGTASADGGQIVIGKPAPLLLGLAPQLLPVSFKSIPIHVNLLALGNLLWARHSAPSKKRLSRNCKGTRLVALAESIATLLGGAAETAHVRFGSLADIGQPFRDVRFTPNNGR